MEEWKSPEGWYGGRRWAGGYQDGEHVYTHGGFHVDVWQSNVIL